jgi:three-Cys-motif partner protein
MPQKDIFDKPFDEGTKTKLEIFEKYLQDWLPTFVLAKYVKPIQIFDLFAGSGYDKNGVAGSPIRILATIKKHSKLLKASNKKVMLYLNDFDPGKFNTLQSNVSAKVSELGIEEVIQIEYSNVSFTGFLNTKRDIFLNGCNLIFIDQNGVKEVTEPVFSFLINCETTEFMFFISSSFIHRFAEEPEFTRLHPKFDFTKIKQSSRKRVHNVVCDEFEKYVPKNIDSYALVPFSIMKDDKLNVYGLIFVTKHILGADKFLHTVWQENGLNGNANYDIDEDAKKNQTDLFDGVKLTKIEGFQQTLRDKVLSGGIANNRTAYYYTINQGHIPKHAADELKSMKNENLISFGNKSPLVTYQKAVKGKIKLEYTLVKR